MLAFGYYWPTMNEDMADFAKSCHTCQVQVNLIHTHPFSLQNMATPWPLYTWGLDLSGPVNPPSGRDIWILEPTDYFSKWVEAIPFRKATSTVVANFIHKHIITRFRALLNQVLLFYILLFLRKWASRNHQSHVAYFDQDNITTIKDFNQVLHVCHISILKLNFGYKFLLWWESQLQ